MVLGCTEITVNIASYQLNMKYLSRGFSTFNCQVCGNKIALIFLHSRQLNTAKQQLMTISYLKTGCHIFVIYGCIMFILFCFSMRLALVWDLLPMNVLDSIYIPLFKKTIFLPDYACMFFILFKSYLKYVWLNLFGFFKMLIDWLSCLTSMRIV